MSADRLRQNLPVHEAQAAPVSPRPETASRRPVLLFFAVIGASIAGLAAAPWPLPLKLMAVVHGLCAQRPSHSFALGGTPLPFDARMTGIYGGTLLTVLFLMARGRARAVGLPPWPIVGALVLFVALMGLDGLNSTLQDFGLAYLYEPDNRLRLGTGLLMGAAVGVVLAYLLNATLWADAVPAPLIAGWREFGGLLLLLAALFLLVLSGWGWLYLPVALALVGGAVLAVTALALVVLVLLYGRENRFQRPADLAGFATTALLIGYAVMALIAAGRFYLELALGVRMPT